MSMNIKNPKAHTLARELASITGESVTEAVTLAIEERLDRVRKAKDTSLAERLMEIARDAAPRWKEPFKSMDHGDLLYDDRGLPK
jgi:antitoxin VapB